MLYLLTGDIETGKTTWLKSLIERAKKHNIALDGIITPAVFKDDKKVAIDCMLLPQCDILRFAWREDLLIGTEKTYETELKMRWIFSDEAVRASNTHLSSITRTNPSEALLLIDELGWLEFNEGSGFTEAMRILDEGVYNDAIVVIRPALLEPAKARWEDTVKIQIIDPGFEYVF